MCLRHLPLLFEKCKIHFGNINNSSEFSIRTNLKADEKTLAKVGHALVRTNVIQGGGADTPPQIIIQVINIKTAGLGHRTLTSIIIQHYAVSAGWSHHRDHSCQGVCTSTVTSFCHK